MCFNTDRILSSCYELFYKKKQLYHPVIYYEYFIKMQSLHINTFTFTAMKKKVTKLKTVFQTEAHAWFRRCYLEQNPTDLQ